MPWFEAILNLLHVVFWNFALGKTIYITVKLWYREKSLGENQDCGLFYGTEKIHTKITLSHFILPLLLGQREKIKFLENPFSLLCTLNMAWWCAKQPKLKRLKSKWILTDPADIKRGSIHENTVTYHSCRTVHFVESLELSTNKCTYIKLHIKTLKVDPTCFDPMIILRELRCSLLKTF